MVKKTQTPTTKQNKTSKIENNQATQTPVKPAAAESKPPVESTKQDLTDTPRSKQAEKQKKTAAPKRITQVKPKQLTSPAPQAASKGAKPDEALEPPKALVDEQAEAPKGAIQAQASESPELQATLKQTQPDEPKAENIQTAPKAEKPLSVLSAQAKEPETSDLNGQDLPSETRFIEDQPPLPEFEMKPESLADDFQTTAGMHSNLDSVTETVADTTPEPTEEPSHQKQPSLFIVQITPELAPVAKVGGLADVVFGLSNELEIRGNHVETILPKYDCLRYDHIWGMCETYGDLWVPWYGGAIHCTVYFGFVHGRKCFFIEPHSADNFFNRGSIYGFNDDVLRFAFFSRAAMEFLWKSGKQPDIIHCHDWQTALVPVFLYEIYQHLGMIHPRVCFTIHNFKHQGATGAQLLQATGLNRPEYYFHYDRMRDNNNPHALNLTKAGVVYSNFITTVSPRHALEAKDQGQGFGLEPTLHIHHRKFGGVVNGIDYSFWNTQYDPYIPAKFDVEHLDDKYLNKKALRDRLLLVDCEKPIVAFVGRLDPQKGLELIRHTLYYTLQQGGQFVLLGSSPDGQINNYFWSLKNQFNDNPHCHIEIGFNEELSHLIYAGADMMVVPSRFEPCGLTQLISMRYGTIPVVREIGGLADTVFDKDYSHKPLHERNGYVFKDYDEKGLEFALGRAISCYYEFPEHFRELIKNSMNYDYSWKNPGQDYLNIYHHIKNK